MKMKQEAEKITKLLFPELKYKDNQNSQLIVVFSGVPGSGKTTIAKKLEEKHKAVRISTGSVRDIIYHSGKFNLSKEQAEKLVQNYLEYLIKNYSFKNKFLILDKSMDRQYQRFFQLFEEQGLKYLIIRIETDPETAINRILKRSSKEKPELVRENMKKWQKEFNDFEKNAHFDVILNGAVNIEKVCKKIDGLINS